MEYPMIFLPVNDGGYVVKSVDIPEAFTEGHDLDEARLMAADALQICLDEYAKEGRLIPPPSDLKAGTKMAESYKLDKEQQIDHSRDILIEMITPQAA